jgi:hypothetical protein
MTEAVSALPSGQPRLVESGRHQVNAPTTVKRFPGGEAVHYRQDALEHGGPVAAILIEAEATRALIRRFLRLLAGAEYADLPNGLVPGAPYRTARPMTSVSRTTPGH